MNMRKSNCQIEHTVYTPTGKLVVTKTRGSLNDIVINIAHWREDELLGVVSVTSDQAMELSSVLSAYVFIHAL